MSDEASKTPYYRPKATMPEHDDGGQAFPGEQGHIPNGTWNQTWNPGMSLHAFYAGLSLMGSRANPNTSHLGGDDLAAVAEKDADAMIAEMRRREKTG